MKTVALAIFPGVQALDVAGPLDVFAEAAAFISPGAGYSVTVAGSDRTAMRASNGMQLQPDLAFDETAPGYDLVLVAGGPRLPHEPASADLTAWLASTATRSRAYGSICTGAFALGQAGLLDGRTVTTHWSDAAGLAEQYPKAQVEHDRIFIRDGRLVTSAGVTAGIDLALALVQEDHGPQVALAVAKRLLVVTQRQGGQSQFSPLLVAPSEEGSPITRVHQHVAKDLRAAHSVAQLAAVAGMSARNFAREFKQRTQLTPASFVEGARVDAARNRLEGGDLPLKIVAYECGFHDPEHMRLAFVRRLGLTPSAYRRQFSLKREDWS